MKKFKITISGIVSFLDEECLRPGDTSDLGFLNKMNINLANHNHFISHVKGDKKTQKELARNVIIKTFTNTQVSNVFFF